MLWVALHLVYPQYTENRVFVSTNVVGPFPHRMAYPQNMTLLSSDDEMWLRSLVIFDNYVFVLWIISKFYFNPKNKEV